MLTGDMASPRWDRMTGPVPPVNTAAVLLGDAVVKLDGLAHLGGRIEHHVPGQPGDLAGRCLMYTMQFIASAVSLQE
jgi:hypothetical protein